MPPVNKFVGRWGSRTKKEFPESEPEVSDGTLDIQDEDRPSTESVKVFHSNHGGRHTGKTPGNTIRITVDIGDGWFKHYEGKRSKDGNRIEDGEYLITDHRLRPGPPLSKRRKRPDDEAGTWTGTKMG